jgi:DMSO/TMAO reductase YedYZ heme-binding membrane subunit
MAASITAGAGDRRRAATLAMLARYGVAVLLGAVLTWLFYLRADTIRSPMHPTLNSFNVGLAYASLVLLGVALAIGPLARLDARRLGRLVPLRREVGVVGAVLALAHVVVSAKVHLEWKWLQFFFTYSGGRRTGVDLEPYGIASWLGLAAVILLLPLVLTSNDWAERYLGASGWKWVQGHSYTVFALVAFHTAIYLNQAIGIKARGTSFWRVFWLVVAIVVALQWLAFAVTIMRRRRANRRTAERLAAE